MPQELKPIIDNPPYPEHECERCDKGEMKVLPPPSDIIGQVALHMPSGNVCMKWKKPEWIRIEREILEKKNG